MKTLLNKQSLAYLLLLLITCSSNFIYGQSKTKATITAANNALVQEVERCSTDERMAQKMLDPIFAAKYNELKARVSQSMQNSMQAPCVNPLVVPIVVHFESGTISNQCMIDASLAQIDQLNEDYASCNSNASIFCDWINAGCDNFGGTAGAAAMPDDGACIQFCLADQNLPAGETTIGGYAITAGDYSSNSQNASNNWQGYFNVYVGAAGGNLGFVPFLSGASNANNTQGASVLTSTFGAAGFSGCEGVGTDGTFSNGATLTHEAGHWFGLEHTFSDSVADTPPQTNPNFGCPTVNLTTCTSSVGNDYGGNFMDYVDDDCMFIFTQDQVDIMIATADAQANWATNSVSCTIVYPPCNDQAGACSSACPTTVNTPINLNYDFCGASDIVSFPNPETSGLVLDDDSDAVYSWSTGNYLSAGGTTVAAPSIQTAINCNADSEVYYLNIDCGATPLSPTLNGGTMVITAYPAPPADVSTLVSITGEFTCNEPIVTPIPGCETYITITAEASNPSFPVNQGDAGIAMYTVAFVSSPNGPDCCSAGEDLIVINANTNDGDLESAGPGAASPWSSTSTNFGTVFCDAGSCGTGGGTINYGVAPNSGSWLAWFGGIGALETGTLSGDFVIPTCASGQSILTFAFENSSCGDAADFIQLQVDGNVVWNFNTDPAACGTPGVPQTITVDISAYADGNSHTLLFTSTVGSSGLNTNFTIDNVILENVGCDAGVTCDATVIGNYDCSFVLCPPNLSLNANPEAAGTYHAEDWVESTSKVNAGSNGPVIYKAGNEYIELQNGFDADGAVEFEAVIEDCD